MVSERLQRQIDALLDEADAAIKRSDWELVRDRAQQVLTIDPANPDGLSYQNIAERGLAGGGQPESPDLRAGPAGDQPHTAGPPSPPPDPGALYRRTFVGRDAELRQLHAAFAAAAAGRGGLVMVVGEPGIGKTSLTEQLAAHVAAQGGLPLVGHCYEEGSLSVPYLPFAEAMRSYVLARPAEALRAQLGPGAADVARLVPEVRDALGALAEPPQDAPEDARWRLYQAIAGFLKQAGAAQPLCIVLEDLHWADRGSLDLLVHLARQLEGARLLVCGTYRDVEVDRQHPLSATLGELRRGSSFLRLPLRGLTVDEVHRLATAILGSGAGWAQTEAVHRQTEGNPLFIQEVLRYLAETAAERRPGEPEGAGAAVIPEGLRDVIGRRLNRLSERTNQVLAVAAVIGRDFPLEVLQNVVTVSEEELTAALEEASGTAIIEGHSVPGRGIGFRFTHALFRQTLYEELFSLRRIRLHQQVARALEARYGRRVDDHAGELAEHFAQSTEVEDMRKALEYSELAAGRALAVYAYGDAVRHYEQALRVQEVLDPDDWSKRCDLLLALGAALLPAGQPERVIEQVAPQALALAEQLDDRSRAYRACDLALEGASRRSAIPSSEPSWKQWLERTQRYAAPGTRQEVRTLMRSAGASHGSGNLGEASRVYHRALEIARGLRDDEALVNAARVVLGNWLNGGTMAPKDSAFTFHLAEELAWRDYQQVSPRFLGFFYIASGLVYLAWGERAKAEALWGQAAALAARSHDPNVVLLVPSAMAVGAVLDGRLEACVEDAAATIQQAEASGISRSGAVYSAWNSFRSLLLLGRYETATRAIDVLAVVADTGAAWGGYLACIRALCHAHQGRAAEARELLDAVLADRLRRDELDETSTTVLTGLLEVAVLLGDAENAARLSAELAGVSGLLNLAPTPIARHLGAASALLGDIPQAEAYYRQALEVCEKVRFRPEIALTRLGLAELLLDHHPGRRAEAIDHLDFAIGEFRAMKMAPSLERALARKGMLGG